MGAGIAAHKVQKEGPSYDESLFRQSGYRTVVYKYSKNKALKPVP